MIRTLLACLLALCVAPAFAQSSADKERADKSDDILYKISQLNIMNQLIPLVMTKDQVRKILPAVEKARQKVKDIEKAESTELKSLEIKVDEAIKAGYEKSATPSPELVKEIGRGIDAMRARRSLIGDENAENVAKVVKETLNAGQIKAAANSLDPKQFNPTIKVEELTADDKLRIFVREIFLHPAAYEVLVKLST